MNSSRSSANTDKQAALDGIYGGAGTEIMKVIQVCTSCWSSFPMTAGDVLRGRSGQILEVTERVKTSSAELQFI